MVHCALARCLVLTVLARGSVLLRGVTEGPEHPEEDGEDQECHDAKEIRRHGELGVSLGEDAQR